VVQCNGSEKSVTSEAQSLKTFQTLVAAYHPFEFSPWQWQHLTVQDDHQGIEFQHYE